MIENIAKVYLKRNETAFYPKEEKKMIVDACAK